MIKKCIRDAISKVRGNNFDVEYSEIKSITDMDGLLKFQEKYLTKLLLHAYKNVPYYHRIFGEVGVVSGDAVDLSKFDKIPILTKEIMREHHEELISKEYTTRKWYYNSSGGSTGEPVRFIQDDVYGKWGNATFYYWYKNILGVDESDVRKVILWGSERDLFKGSTGLKAKIINWLTNTVFLNSFKMSDGAMKKYIETINSYKPDLIRGYTGSLYELCRYAERKNTRIHTPKIVVSSAETLSDEMREKIETVFGMKVYDYYGSRETNNLAGECESGLMHILAFHNYVEVLDIDNLPVKEGCRNPLPTLRKITGRITDCFTLENGTTVPAEYFIHLIGVICNKGFIKKFQVIQEDYKRVRILVIIERIMEELEKKDIEDKIKLVMGNDCKIIWEFVDEIHKTQSGKYLYTRSLIGANQGGLQ